MAIPLSALKTGVDFLPPRQVWHGVGGIGKTTLASKAKSPLFIQCEDGEGLLDITRFNPYEYPKPFDSILEFMDTLITVPDHGFWTCVVDTIDWLERIILKAVCSDNNVDSIEDIGYGKGYVYAIDYWQKFLNKCDFLRKKGINVVLLAHTEIMKFNSPEMEPYDRYELKLNKKYAPIIFEWADIVAFLNYDVTIQKDKGKFGNETTRAVGGTQRNMFFYEKPAYKAKNRYSLPESCPMHWETYNAMLIDAIKNAKNRKDTDNNGTA